MIFLANLPQIKFYLKFIWPLAYFEIFQKVLKHLRELFSLFIKDKNIKLTRLISSAKLHGKHLKGVVINILRLYRGGNVLDTLEIIGIPKNLICHSQMLSVLILIIILKCSVTAVRKFLCQLHHDWIFNHVFKNPCCS